VNQAQYSRQTVYQRSNRNDHWPDWSNVHRQSGTLCSDILLSSGQTNNASGQYLQWLTRCTLHVRFYYDRWDKPQKKTILS